MIPSPLLPYLIAALTITGAAILIVATVAAWIIPQIAHMVRGDYEPEDESEDD